MRTIRVFNHTASPLEIDASLIPPCCSCKVTVTVVVHPHFLFTFASLTLVRYLHPAAERPVGGVTEGRSSRRILRSEEDA
jgi:hypothetical protein